jgi:hypothetical protein
MSVRNMGSKQKKRKQHSKMTGVVKKEDQALSAHRIHKKNKDDNA